MTNPSQNPWQNRWKLGQTGWDLGSEHPLLTELMGYIEQNNLLPTNARAYTPGCGRAHEAAFLAQKGLNVVGADFAESAIEAAQERYGDINHLQLRVEDALLPPPKEESNHFDLVCDRAMLCAIQPNERSRYVSAMAKRLKVGGLFAGILFASLNREDKENGPPFALDDEQMFELFSEEFSLVYLTHRSIPTIPIINSEWLVIWRKKTIHT